MMNTHCLFDQANEALQENSTSNPPVLELGLKLIAGDIQQ